MHNNENGCGALTGWEWHDATDTKGAFVYFNLPFWMKAGCVERAIASAGGPKIQCQGQGVGPPTALKRDWKEVEVAAVPSLNSTTATAATEPREPDRKTKMQASFPLWTKQQTEEFSQFYEARQPRVTEHPSYVPMDWGITSTATAMLADSTAL